MNLNSVTIHHKSGRVESWATYDDRRGIIHGIADRERAGMETPRSVVITQAVERVTPKDWIGILQNPKGGEKWH